MFIRYVWPNRTYSDSEGNVSALDAFWVEATRDEAETCIFPALSPDTISMSERFAADFRHVAEHLGHPAHQFCFLVAGDLHSIEPHPVHYPVHQLWGAYSPFRLFPEVTISNLDEVRTIVLPPGIQERESE